MGKILVAYFSATGITKALAEKLAGAAGADLHEIKPKMEYTRADLDWTDKGSRSSIEMKDKSFRPEITGSVANMEAYDTIFVAFPIWWYVAPTIVNTFLESYDLQGKTIIPVATSGGSGMGNTSKELEVSCKGAVLKEGKVFSKSVSESDLKTWVDTVTE